MYEMKKRFDDLGAAIDGRWEIHGYDQSAFGEIASETLSLSKIWQDIDALSLLDYVCSGSSIDDIQMRNSFADCQITLFRNSRFYIEILFWINSVPSIHDHGFSGAFVHVLGGSVHSTYKFLETAIASRNLALGQLSTMSCEPLSIGQGRPIYSHQKFIHSITHTTLPSATLVCRTFRDIGCLQYDYQPPFVRINTAEPDIVLSKYIRSLSILYKYSPQSCLGRVKDCFEKGSLESAYWTLQSRLWTEFDPSTRRCLMSALSSREHGMALIHSFRDTVVLENTHASRQKAISEDQRVFLGVLTGNTKLSTALAYYEAAESSWAKGVESFIKGAKACSKLNLIGTTIDEHLASSLGKYLRTVLENNEEKTKSMLIAEYQLDNFKSDSLLYKILLSV